ncbi:MAG: bifunctional DNA-formamidopyrimidine glycosylase/DNA-(apurinic or apyrimidinic site) lyase [Cytophagaceae bacterium]|nr:bifunctional DNA-formamidopyrimidine glycosylase/DNA-(apurinic or apyrimidinic site) lyase [Gemmatimonadaceae bacterium]
MPELPEVEYAANVARQVTVGRTIERVSVHHPAQRRSLPAAAARRMAGDQVVQVERRGKYQVFHLSSGRALAVHFRMNGDWERMEAGAPLPRHARVIIHLSGGVALALTDSRALATVTLHSAGTSPFPDLGPEANTDAFNAPWLAGWFRKRRGPVKPSLLDQRAVAGIGNIYASEALWYARIDPRTPVNRLDAHALERLVRAVKRVMEKALSRPERYYNADGSSSAARFNVYDREGKPCRRCGTEISRIVQAGRSTYYCGVCVAVAAAKKAPAGSKPGAGAQRRSGRAATGFGIRDS